MIFNTRHIMNITLIQQNYTISDFDRNLDLIISEASLYPTSDFIVFSELCLSGYYPGDLIHRPAFMAAQDLSLNRLLQFSESFHPYLVIGAITPNHSGVGKPFYNSLFVIHHGKIVFKYHKQLLPTYNIFDEHRHFEPGDLHPVETFMINGVARKIGFFICEDGWNDHGQDYPVNPLEAFSNQNLDAILSINASPYHQQKHLQRDRIFSELAKKYKAPLVYVNQVGANDDIIFDGASFVFNSNGDKILQLPQFKSHSATINVLEHNTPVRDLSPDLYEEIFHSISSCLRDFCFKQNLTKVVVGCSGGVDSALTLAIAALTLGPSNVHAITMPSQYSSEGSVTDSQDLCRNLSIALDTIPIGDAYTSIQNSFSSSNLCVLSGVASENLQARIRGTILMGYSNQHGHLLLTTGNKSELSVGYYTLYGDSCGGLNLIGDLYKTEVYELCKWINLHFDNVIPANILNKAPSAELAPGQKDSDSLPDYPHLDAILYQELEWDFLNDSARTHYQKLIDEVDPSLYHHVLRLIDRAEFKRKQAALIARIHPRAFGTGRRIPIVKAFLSSI